MYTQPTFILPVYSRLIITIVTSIYDCRNVHQSHTLFCISFILGGALVILVYIYFIIYYTKEYSYTLYLGLLKGGEAVVLLHSVESLRREENLSWTFEGG